MTQAAEGAARWRNFFAWLREELAPRPGRVAAVARIAAGCAIATAVAMTFQIPKAALVVIFVFVVSKAEVVATLLTAVTTAIGITLAVALTMVLYSLDASEPALRLPLMAVIAFLAMFLLRVSALGPVAFLVGVILWDSQTIVDNVPSTEVLTRVVLWLWVMIMTPVAVATLIDLLFGEKSARLGQRTALSLLDSVTAALDRSHAPGLARQQAEAFGLVGLHKHAQIADRQLRERKDVDHRLIETLVELMTLVDALPSATPHEVRKWLADTSVECRRAYASEHAPAPRPLPEALVSGLAADVLPIVMAIDAVLGRLGSDIARRRMTAESPVAPTAKTLFAPDAWSNPAHVRFALKATLAVMAAYFIYTILDWPGISTAVLTCFVVALGSLGESIHKMWLRISGALIGGLAAGLCIVYLLPGMTDIGQLCLLVVAASAICAWVSTSSDRLSYVGLQMAVAFFLGVLQGYGPSTDLNVAWDRVVGILLGNLLMSIVFSVVWPVSALDSARGAIAQALRALGNLMSDAVNLRTDARLAAARSLNDARHLTETAMFERNLLKGRKLRSSFEEVALVDLERLASGVFVVVGQSGGAGAGEVARKQDAATADWFTATAQRFAAGQSAPAAPGQPTIAPAQAVLPGVGTSLRAAIEARVLLQREIEHVAAIPA